MLSTLVFFMFSLATSTNAHMLLGLPSTWGLNNALEDPLTASTSNWFCGGRRRDRDTTTTINAGQVFQAPIICGEAINNVPNAGYQCSSDFDQERDYHNGGGCALSIAYTRNPTLNDFIVFSVNHDCPQAWNTYIPFHVPANLPAGEATLAWTWIPRTAQDEIYFNCANIRVNGPPGRLEDGRRLVNHIIAVPGFGTPSPRPLYANVLPNGAQSIRTSTTTSPPPPPPPTPPSQGGGCQGDRSQCSSDPKQWHQCANGVWVAQPVPNGLRCVQNGSQIAWTWA